MNTNKYQLSFTSKDGLSLIKEKIQQANISIDIEAYYFSEDSVGREILDLLIHKSIQGIKIRMLLDHVGSYDFSKSNTIKRINTEFNNIDIRFFNSIFPFSKHKKSFAWLCYDRSTGRKSNSGKMVGFKI